MFFVFFFQLAQNRSTATITMLPHTLALSTLLLTTTATRHAHRSRSTSADPPACDPAKSADPGYTDTPITLPADTSRTYTLYIPESYNGTAAFPLIISYHGHNGNSNKQASITSFNDSDVNPNYIVAFPQGVDGTDGESAWQGASYADPDVDDVAFTDQLLDQLIGDFCVDKDRIYASGKSNGGGFVDTLACSSVGGRFAAFSACSGAFYTDMSFNGSDGTATCNATRDGTSRSVFPFLETHGHLDDTIRYDGNPEGKGHGETPVIPEWLGWWAQRNGCDADDKGSDDKTQDGALNHTTWDCGGNEGVVQGYWVQDLEHWWPGGEGDSTTLNASEVILEFYGMWTRQS